MVYSIVFSPTGGTAKVTEALTKAFENVHSLDLCDYNTTWSDIRFTANDIVFFGVPSFKGRVPALAAQRISQMNGNGAKAVLVCVYGNREFDDTLVELQDLCESIGMYPVAAAVAIAQHSELPGLAQGRPDAEDLKALSDMATVLKAKLDSKSLKSPRLPGNRPYKPDTGVTIPPVVSDSCTKCKSCATLCPSQAISYANPKVTDATRCISCMRCVKVCPTGARQLNPMVAQRVSTFLAPFFERRKEPQLWV